MYIARFKMGFCGLSWLANNIIKFIGTRLTTQIDLQSLHDGCSETTELKVSLEFRAFLTTCQETPHFFSKCLRLGKCECVCVRD